MDVPRTLEGDLQARDLRLVILASRYNERVVDALVRGAIDALNADQPRRAVAQGRMHGARLVEVRIARLQPVAPHLLDLARLLALRR
ncbi:MAG: hypothetical protein ACO4B5_03615, partial [Steroidobacteraceae bacterium]